MTIGHRSIQRDVVEYLRRLSNQYGLNLETMPIFKVYSVISNDEASKLNEMLYGNTEQDQTNDG